MTTTAFVRRPYDLVVEVAARTLDYTSSNFALRAQPDANTPTNL